MTPPPSTFDDRHKKSFDFLQDATKQVLTLATAILTFTITFLKDVAKSASGDARTTLTGAWVLLVVSSIFGLMCLFNMAGLLDKESDPSIYRGTVRLFSGLQLSLFGVALILALVFAYQASQPTAT